MLSWNDQASTARHPSAGQAVLSENSTMKFRSVSEELVVQQVVFLEVSAKLMVGNA